MDRTGAPEIAAWRRHTLAIEINSDIARRAARDVFGEDAPHNPGLGLDNGSLAALARTGA